MNNASDGLDRYGKRRHYFSNKNRYRTKVMRTTMEVIYLLTSFVKITIP